MRTVLIPALALGVLASGAWAQRDGDFDGRAAARQLHDFAQQPDNALRVGQLAPTFVLQSFDGKETYHLAHMRDQRPVILFFGSYT